MHSTHRFGIYVSERARTHTPTILFKRTTLALLPVYLFPIEEILGIRTRLYLVTALIGYDARITNFYILNTSIAYKSFLI